MKEEFIICAAIRLDDTGKIFYGHRHNHCFSAIYDELSYEMNRREINLLKKTQGFVTNLNRFVNREEALLIALENNQVLNKNEIRGNDLYSEDLY